jgi:hypothetical protein
MLTLPDPKLTSNQYPPHKWLSQVSEGNTIPKVLYSLSGPKVSLVSKFHQTDFQPYTVANISIVGVQYMYCT